MGLTISACKLLAGIWVAPDVWNTQDRQNLRLPTVVSKASIEYRHKHLPTTPWMTTVNRQGPDVRRENCGRQFVRTERSLTHHYKQASNCFHCLQLSSLWKVVLLINYSNNPPRSLLRKPYRQWQAVVNKEYILLACHRWSPYNGSFQWTSPYKFQNLFVIMMSVNPN